MKPKDTIRNTYVYLYSTANLVSSQNYIYFYMGDHTEIYEATESMGLLTTSKNIETYLNIEITGALI